MDKTYTKISLENIGNGAAPELFARELQKVIDNIADINCPAESARTITLKITVKPHQSREMGEVRVNCTSTLAGVKPQLSSIFLVKEMGKPAAFKQDIRQMELDVNKDATPAPLAVAGSKGNF